MNWRDYLFFSKGERTAIIALLTLIVLSSVLYMLTLPSKQLETSQEFKNTENKRTENHKENIAKEQSTPAQSYNKNIPKYPAKLSQGETIELNAADTAALKKIPGIGSSYARRIIKYKNILGGYANIKQLKEVWGIDDELYSKIAPFIRVEKETDRIRINTASFDEINKHPYINDKQAKVIIDIRERKGRIESINRLSLLDEFNSMDIDRLKDYVSFE